MWSDAPDAHVRVSVLPWASAEHVCTTAPVLEGEERAAEEVWPEVSSSSKY